MDPSAALSSPVELYRLDPATEAAADTWPVIIETQLSEECDEITALRCAECRQSLGLNEGYTLPHDHIRPLILAHITRSHGYAANPERAA